MSPIASTIGLLADPTFRDDARGRTAAALRALDLARKQAGLTHADLARRAGLAPRHWQNLRSGHANPSLLTLHALARAAGLRLHVSFHALPPESAP